MAVLCQSSTFFSCASHNYCAFRCPSLKIDEQQQKQLRWGTHRYPPRKDMKIYASSTKKPRVNKKVKSNVDLCNDLREFVSTVGLPEGHVPTLKELLQHGRKDLANIVRRRGYKLIKEFLANTTKGDTDIETSSTEKQDAINNYKKGLTGQDKKVNELGEDLSSSSEVSITENYFSRENSVPPLISGHQSSNPIEYPTSSSLQEKAAKFIQNGELDTIEDMQLPDSLDLGYGISIECGTEESKGWIELENEIEIESTASSEEYSEYDTGSKSASLLNGRTLTSERVVPPVKGNHLHRDVYSSTEGLKDADFDEDLDVEASEKDNQVEINRLKVMLHQKELELSQLKEQIEKEKLASSILQTKAETEIGKAQKLISEKDAELQSAEESLSGLKEVQIEYWGNAETVEVAGSFNGWHHQIKMDQYPLSNTINPIGSRESRLWSTELWLYPGIYEIKFIVDGHWRIDPKRESVSRGNVQNNILRVDR